MQAPANASVPLHALVLGVEEEEAALRVLRSGGLMGNGVECAALEAAAGAILGVSEVLATTSCTSSLEMAVLALGIGPGDEVIVPAWTFVTSASAVARSGATVVFCDVDPATGNADLRHIEPLVSARTRAVMVVHYGGRVAPLDPLLGFCAPRGIHLIEDAAHALGAGDAVSAAGTRGSVGCFSLHGSKNVGCGEGGLVWARDPGVREKMRVLREKGTNREAWARGEASRWEWMEVGSSYVLAELLAAVATVQLGRLAEVTASRQQIAERYGRGLAEASRIGLPPPALHSCWHLYPVVVSPELRPKIIDRLEASGISSAPHYVGLHTSPWAKRRGIPQGPLPGVEALEAGLLRLPIHPMLGQADQDRVIERVARADAE